MNEQEITQFHFALTSLIIAIKQTITKAAGAYGLTSFQVMVLSVLVCQFEEPPAMQTLATIFGCDASNITGIIDTLERKKLVSRGEKPGDRRVKVVHLEPAGREICTKILEYAAADRGNHFISRLSDEEARAFVSIVAKLSTPAGATTL